ncbi:MAG: DnaJ domain-containing protein [Pseudomonadota bacterium]|nr:DnaJ domain-containing protein [Pseudomonadota bacterium]
MKFKDYYSLMGLERSATPDQIKTTYRKLARKYHPDVSKEPNAEERFKEVQEAYETLKDPEKRAAYDQLGRHPEGQEFRPPPGWGANFGDGASFEDIDLSDLFAGLAGRRGRAGSGPRGAMHGQDFEAAVRITFNQAYHGAEIDLDLAASEVDANGVVRRVPHHLKVRIPKGVADGTKLRVPGKGGKGINGGRDGDLYLQIEVAPHPVFRADGQDLYLDLPLAPWEAALGASIEMPTPTGKISLKIPAGTRAGQQFRIPGRGLARAEGKSGDLYAVAAITVPTVLTDRQRGLWKELAEASTFDPRAHLETGGIL